MKILSKSEPLFKINKSPRVKTKEDDLVSEEKSKIFEQVIGVMYLLFILIIFFFVILELKREYQIDLIPGINTPFDDIYFNVKEGFSNPPADPNAPTQ